MYQITQIYIYPIKSLAGISLQKSICEPRGLQYDRRWVIVDQNNNFISQRSHPKMALLQPQIMENEQGVILKIFDKTNPSQAIVIENATLLNSTAQAEYVTVWDDTILALPVLGAVNQWLSSQLGSELRLMYMPNSTLRKVDSKYSISGQELTSFSDGYPYLFLGQAAIDSLNLKLQKPVDSRRFRPNIVFTGGHAHDEDLWAQFQINGLTFYGVKNCARCPVPNIDPDTAVSTKEPIKTLSEYRFKNNKVYFGQNVLISNNYGQILVGDIITPTSTGPT